MLELISEKNIASTVAQLAHEIEEPDLMVVVAVGGMLFGADLLRALYRVDKNPRVGIVSCSSYGDSRTASGPPIINGLQGLKVEGKKILVVDDVLDTGVSLKSISRGLKALGAYEVKTCVLVDKMKGVVRSDYAGYRMTEDFFLVGYGMDNAGRDRGLPYVGVI
jgi:hypoxanthine phosphoribosyltransferase